MPTETEFHKRIAKLLIDKGRTRQELADHLQLTESGICRRLAGNRAFKVNEVPELAQFFDVPVRALFPPRKRTNGAVLPPDEDGAA